MSDDPLLRFLPAFGSLLARLRSERNWTVDQLALAIELSSAEVKSMERAANTGQLSRNSFASRVCLARNQSSCLSTSFQYGAAMGLTRSTSRERQTSQDCTAWVTTMTLEISENTQRHTIQLAMRHTRQGSSTRLDRRSH